MTNDVRHGRLMGEQGSLLPEFALAAPLLLVMLLGIFEFGMAWRNSNLFGATMRGAARSTAQMQDDPQADRVGLQSYQGSIAGLKRTTTQKVIIYLVNDTNPNGALPTACQNASTAGTPPFGVNTGTMATGTRCNVYTPGQLAAANLVAANFGCAAGDYDVNFCPTTRVKSLAGSGPTIIGVWAQVQYQTITKILPVSTITITDKATYRVEPVAS
jgi:Flp pilus assembly protein TadG